MSKTAALTDFNRSPNTLLAELPESQQPCYLTKNGKACAVIMDPDAFERAMSFRAEAREREMRVYDGVLRGYEDYCAGRVTPAREALAALREKKGW